MADMQKLNHCAINASLGYVGDIKSNLREGYGAYTYPNSFFKYEGEWHSSVKNGIGSLIMKDGSYYKGQFRDGEIDGSGFRFWAATGNTYTGEFEKGEICGKGVMKYGTGSTYQGYWLDNKQQGEGVLMDSDGSVYRGSFYSHKRHGEGEQTYSAIGAYEGGWVSNCRQGHGKMRWLDGSTYEGQWRADDMHGEGELTHFSQIIYGMWNNGRPLDEAASICAVGGMEVILNQGELPFTINIVIKSLDNELSLSESGRHLQLTAGARVAEKASSPSKDSSNSARNETANSASVTTENTPKNDNCLSNKKIHTATQPPLGRITTPFGFDVQPYPVFTKTLLDGVSEDSINEIPLIDSPVTATTQSKEGDPAEPTTSVEPSPISFKDVVKCVNDSRMDSPASLELLPVATQTTINGKATFTNLFLPPVNSNATQSLSSASPENVEVKNTTRRKQDSSGKGKKKVKQEEKTEELTVPDVQCKPGDYVMIIEDITESPFLDILLDPLYIHVKILPQPKRSKSRIEKHK